MTIKFLLDTNIISQPVKKMPSKKVLKKLEDHSSAISISAITWHELCYGVSRLEDSKRKTVLEKYVELLHKTIPILPYEDKAASWHGSQRAQLESEGNPQPFADGQIAAIANSNNLILVTDNIKDFKKYTDLSITNWMS